MKGLGGAAAGDRRAFGNNIAQNQSFDSYLVD